MVISLVSLCRNIFLSGKMSDPVLRQGVLITVSINLRKMILPILYIDNIKGKGRAVFTREDIPVIHHYRSCPGYSDGKKRQAVT